MNNLEPFQKISWSTLAAWMRILADQIDDGKGKRFGMSIENNAVAAIIGEPGYSVNLTLDMEPIDREATNENS